MKDSSRNYANISTSKSFMLTRSQRVEALQTGPKEGPTTTTMREAMLHIDNADGLEYRSLILRHHLKQSIDHSEFCRFEAIARRDEHKEEGKPLVGSNVLVQPTD